MPLEYLIAAAVTLFVVVDPIGLAPTFLSVTAGIPAPARRDVALRATVIAGAILAGTALIGDWLLRQLGITLPAFRIAGGLLPCSRSRPKWCSECAPSGSHATPSRR